MLGRHGTRRLPGGCLLLPVIAALVAVLSATPVHAYTISVDPDSKDEPFVASIIIALTAGGPALTRLDVATGEGVRYVNADSISHELRFDPPVGVDCGVSPIVIEPGGNRACFFSTVGAYRMRDLATAVAGSQIVLVGSPADVLTDVTLTVTPDGAGNRHRPTLIGRVNVPQAGIRIDIVARPLSTRSYRLVGTVTTAADGAFGFVSPLKRAAIYVATAVAPPRITMSTPTAA